MIIGIQRNKHISDGPVREAHTNRQHTNTQQTNPQQTNTQTNTHTEAHTQTTHTRRERPANVHKISDQHTHTTNTYTDTIHTEGGFRGGGYAIFSARVNVPRTNPREN